MEWKLYFPRIVRRLRLKLVGWPHTRIGASGLDYAQIDELRLILGMWKDGVILFERVSDEEFRQLDETRNRLIREGILKPDRPTKPRCDKGDLRYRPSPDTRGRRSHGPIKSKKYVEPEDDEEDCVDRQTSL